MLRQIYERQAAPYKITLESRAGNIFASADTNVRQELLLLDCLIVMDINVRKSSNSRPNAPIWNSKGHE